MFRAGVYLKAVEVVFSCIPWLRFEPPEDRNRAAFPCAAVNPEFTGSLVRVLRRHHPV